MKSVNYQNLERFQMYRVRKFILLALLIVFSLRARSQCYSGPTYCTPSFTNVSNYSIGIQNVTLTSGSGASINNTTVATGNSPNYYDYSDSTLAGAAGAGITGTVKNGSGNTTTIRIFVDYNQDGTFSASAPELVWTSGTTTASAVVAVSFTIPGGTAAGVYKMRVTGDIGGSGASPCALGYGEVEDYSLIVTSGTADAYAITQTLPTNFSLGSNTIAFKLYNISNTTMTTVDIGYRLGSNAAVTQSLSGLSVASGRYYTATFSTALSIGSAGTYSLKTWLNNVNGAGTQTAANDTVCRTFIVCSAPLSGNYTINPAGSGPTNYTSFAAADSALVYCGISGPVRFTVAAGTYNEQIYISTVSGSSAVNTITFTGAGSSSTIVTYATNSSNLYVARLNACKYITFRDMAFKSSGATDGWIFHLLSSEKCKVANSLIEFTNASAQSSSGANLAGVVINASAGALNSSATIADSNYIDTCIINYGYYNIYNNVNNTSVYPVTFVRGDSLTNAYYAAVFFAFNTSHAFKVLNNRITLRTGASGQYGIYSGIATPGNSRFLEISGNRLSSLNGSGIGLWGGGGPSGVLAGKIYNNVLGGSTRGATSLITFAISCCAGAANWNIYHNTFILDYSSGTSYGYNAVSQTNGANLKNNIFYNTSATANNIGITATNSSAFSTVDYNNFYTAYTGGTFASIGGVTYNAANYRAAYTSGLGLNSLNSVVSFLSSTDFHHTTSCLNGQTGLGISTDFDGTTRGGTPTMGAYEASGVPTNDIGVFSLTAPVYPVVAGVQNIRAKVKNYGSTAVSSVTLNYSLNGAAPVTQTFILGSPLSLCDTTTVTFTTTATIPSGSNTLKVYLGSGDANINNDTLSSTICVALNGTYTIDGSLPASSTNFVSFASANSILNCGGVSGPVTFNIASNTYTEQVLLSNITGASATNKITFQSASGTPSDVVVTYAGISSANYTIGLLNASYIKFRNMTITATGTSYGAALSVTSNSSYDSFYNVVFNSVTTTTNSSNLAVIYSPSGNNNFLYFDTCRINNGSHGTYFSSGGSSTSTQNLTFNNCDFSNQYAYGMYHTNLNGLVLTKNRISTNSALTTYFGMYNYWIYINTASNKPIIRGNKISGALGGHGMHNSYFGVNSGTSGKRPLIANNMIQIGASANATYGIRVTNDYGSNYMHNSVNIGTSQSTNASSAAFFETVSASSDTVINNSFTAYNGASAIRMDVPASYTLCNKNNYYTTTGSTFLGFVSGSSYTTLATWQGATSKDAGSFNANPFYTSNSDLHSNSGTMNNAGLVTAQVTTDYDNVSRCPNGGCPGGTALPDIGCDEYLPVALDGSIQSINTPTSTCVGSLNSVQVTLKNIGSSTLTSDSIGWSVNGVVQPTYYWSGSIAQGATTTATIGSFTAVAGANIIKAWASYPNGGVDGNNSNDTATLTPSITLSGAYTIGGTSPDYATFTAAASALNTGGICGPVTFYVRQGTYNERIQLNAISGSSATNFISFVPDPSNTLPAEISIGTNSGTSDNHTIFLNGTSFIMFRGLTITNTSTGSYKSAVRFALAQDSVVLASNIISSATSTSSSQNEAVINHGTAAVDSISRFYLDSNTINNGSIGVYMRGNTSVTRFENKNKIRNNQILGSYYYGVYSQFQRNVDILYNTITMSASSSTSSIGLYIDYNDTFRIESNYINNFGSRGIYLSSANYQGGTGNAYSTIINNMVGGNTTGTSAYGIYFNAVATFGSKYIRIYHNSISVNSSATAAAFFFQQTSAGMFDYLDIKNNSFANFGGGTYAAYFYMSPAMTSLILNYNNYYTSGANKFVIGTTAYSTATGGSPTYNANSKSGNPGYINSTTDLHSISSQLSNSGINLGTVTTDIDGNTRPLSPDVTVDIGADDYNIPAYNLGVNSMTAPACPLTPGLQNIAFTFTNYGTTTITSATANYKVGINGTVKSTAWTGSIATSASSTATFSGANQYNFTGAQIDTVYFWIADPNGSPDTYTANDSSTNIYYVALSGTYTLGGTSPSFATFTAVANALNCAGITGPVVINVRNGTYSDQISLGGITGSSATNTIIFQSELGVAANVILQASSGASYTVRMTNSKYITFRNMTVKNSNSPGNAFYLNPSGGDSASNISITGCSMTTTWSSGATLGAIYANGNTPDLRIVGNSITNSGGIYITGISTNINTYTRTITIDSNSINTSGGDVYMPLSMYYANAPKVRFNTVTRSAGGGALTMDISNITGAMEFSYNKVQSAGVLGVRMQNMNINGETTPVMVFNNFFQNNNTSANYYAMDLENSNYVNVYNNSFYQNSNGTSAYAMRTYASAARSNVRLVNNCFVSNTSGTSSIPLGILGSSLAFSKAMITECNYNNYYVVGGAGAILAKVYTTNYTTVALLAGQVYTSPSNNDANSVNLNPSYTNASASGYDLHTPTSGSNLLGLGTILSSITTDVDYTPRAFPPCIGADEVNNAIRTTTGDYQLTTSCPTLSGTNWISIRDASGNILFSINPNGNNLGSTCYGIRLYSGSGLRTDSTKVYNSGENKFGYFLDRNFYITPTTQPSTPVSVRFYAKATELQELIDTVFGKYGTTLSIGDIDVSKYGGSVDLNPNNNSGTSSDFILLNSTTGSYGSDYYLEVSTPSFSEFGPSYTPENPSSPLPVTWLKFDAVAKGNDARLQWTLASEHANEGFIIERSMDGKEFVAIGKVASKGDFVSEIGYYFIDEGASALGSKLYYRIKQIDISGASSQTEIRMVQYEKISEVTVINAWPNPAGNEINIAYDQLSLNAPVQIRMMDLSGKVVMTKLLNPESANGSIKISIDGLESGIYMVEWSNGTLTKTLKFVKQ